MRSILLAVVLAAATTAFAKPLVVCTESNPDGFDIVQFNSLVTTNASADVLFNTLVTYDERAQQIAPSLSTTWTTSADGRAYTLRLRPGVAFQTTAYFKPTRPLNADDVIFSFDRMLNPRNPWHNVSGAGGFPHAQAMGLTKLIKAIVKLDSHSLRFELNEPNAALLSILTMGFTSIYSAEYAGQLLKAGKTAHLNGKPIGTGPFILARYTKDAVIRYDPNPLYWGMKPKIDRLVYAITPDPSVRAQKVKTGECQITLSPKPQDLAAAQTSSALKVLQTPAFMTAFVALNVQKKPLDDAKVRQALNLAFDRNTYLKVVFDGTATPANNPYPPNTWSDAKSIAPYPHDPARAKKLLAQAGFPNGFNTTIWTRATGSTLNPNPKVGAELLQADLAKIGVKATIKVLEWGELIKRAKLGHHDLLFMGWAGDNGDPDNYLTPLFSCDAVQSGINFSRYCSSQLDQLIIGGKRAAARTQRTQLYEAAQRIIHDQALWIPLGYPTAAVLTRKNVSGYRVSPFGRQNFTSVTVQ